MHKVIPENSWEQKIEDIKKYDIDIFAMGGDWEGKFDELKEYCEVIYLPRTEDISSTDLKQQLKQISNINLEDLNKAFEILKRIREDFE